MALDEAINRFDVEFRILAEVIADVRDRATRLTNTPPSSLITQFTVKQMAKDPMDPAWNERLVIEHYFRPPDRGRPAIETLDRNTRQIHEALNGEAQDQLFAVLTALDSVRKEVEAVLVAERARQHAETQKRQLTLF